MGNNCSCLRSKTIESDIFVNDERKIQLLRISFL